MKEYKNLVIFLEESFNDYSSCLPFNPSYNLLAYIIKFYFCILVIYHCMINILCIAMLFRNTSNIGRDMRERSNSLQLRRHPALLDRIVNKTFLYAYILQIPLGIETALIKNHQCSH